MAKLENELTWSVSRDQLFRECQRAYYYQYYGSWGGWEIDAPEQTRKLYVLKNMKTLVLWAGNIVHETIAEALNRYAHKNSPVKSAELQARARQKLRAGWTQSVTREWLETPKKTNIHELYYGNGKSLPAEQTDRVKDRVYGALAAFADSDTLREILTIPYMSWKPVDKLDSFSLNGLKVWCAIDFAYVDPAGDLRILDWKTGAENREALQTQLGCYALYAAEKWFSPLEAVKLFGVFLNENARTSEYRASPEVIVNVQERILAGAAAMRVQLADVRANRPLEEDAFPVCDNERVCRYCNYREVCPRIEARIQDSGSL